MKISLVKFSKFFDWEALYVDGELAIESSRITLESFLEYTTDLDCLERVHVEYEFSRPITIGMIPDNRLPRYLDDLLRAQTDSNCSS